MNKYNTHKPSDDIPPEITHLARDLYRAGRWGETLDRVRLAQRDFYNRRRDRTDGDALEDDMLAGDLAKLVGADMPAARAAFRRTSGNVWDAVLLEMRAMLAAPDQQSAGANGIRVSVGGRKYA